MKYVYSDDAKVEFTVYNYFASQKNTNWINLLRKKLAKLASPNSHKGMSRPKPFKADIILCKK